MAVLSKVANIAVQPQPVGVVEAFAGSNAPNGWLICDGSQVLRSLYPELFSVIGTTYGSGDGFSTFTLPDLRGRTIAGRDGINNMNNGPTNRLTSTYFGASGTALGNSGGVESHTLTEAQLASHTHIQNPHGHTVNGATVWNNIASNALRSGNANVGSLGTVSLGSATAVNQNAGSGNAHNNTQPTMILNYIIKAVSELPRGGWYNSSSPDLVTSLPTNPYTGQEVILVQTVAGTTYHIAKRYDGAIWKSTGPDPALTWITPTFQNNWVNYSAGFQDARYTKDSHGTVFIEGLIRAGASATVAFTLNQGYRPAAQLGFPTVANSALGRIDIRANGEVFIDTGSSVWTFINVNFKASQ